MSRVERWLTVLSVVAAIAVAAATVRREFFPGEIGPRPRDREVSMAQWESLLRASTPLGPVTSGPTLVVVTDFQCPACKLFHERLELVFGERLGATDIRYAHLPLSYHAAALPAAKLFECAVRRGSVARRVATALFENQDSLALLSSADLLQRSGVTRVSEALDCIATADSTFFEAIWQSSSIARDVSVPGTPAVFLDGKLLALPPDETRLREIFSR